MDLNKAKKSALEFLGEMPIAKAIAGVIQNPTPQEVGQQAYNLGGAISKGIQEFTARAASDPVEAGSLVSPIGGLGAMVAYHGSPHKFNKFSMSKIGTGEGAQAYGHGLYFAGNEKIAKSYAEKLGGDMFFKVGNDSFSIVGNRPENGAAWTLNVTGGDIDSAIKYSQGKTKEILQSWKGKKIIQEKGNLYKVDIPEENLMLDWDKPISMQPQIIKENILNISDKLKKIGVNVTEETTGSGIYNAIKEYRGGNDSAVSEYLNSLGIKGIKYLDAGSRSAGKGSHNYVVFDDKDIKILERNAEKFLEE